MVTTNALNVLIDRGAKVYMSDQQGRTSLMLAVANSHLNCVNLLLKAGADVNSKDEDECTALIFALLACQESCVDVLIAAGADVNVTYKGRSALMQVVIDKSERLVDKLIAAGADVNAVDESGNSVLIHSVYARDDEHCVNVLVKAGADVNYSYGGLTVLMAAAIQGHVNSVRALIKAGADVNKKSNNIITNHTDTVERVLKGSPNREQEMDTTSLVLAARCVKSKCVEALIEGGADVNLTDEDGCTALLAASSSKENLMDIYTCMKLLIDAKADVNAPDNNGNTALLFTVNKIQYQSEGDPGYAHENKRLFDLLLQSGAKVNLANHKNITPLILTARFGCPKYVEVLVKAGADVNLVTADGETAFLTAVNSKRRDKECIQLLINAGVNVNASDINRNTSFDVFCRKRIKGLC